VLVLEVVDDLKRTVLALGDIHISFRGRTAPHLELLADRYINQCIL